MKKIIVILFLVLFLSACVPPDDKINISQEEVTVLRIEAGYAYINNVYRFVDYDAGVVCWMLHQDGISCLPIGETTLNNNSTGR